jgi:cell wall-associated NlpC family hydrolase
MNKFVGIPFIDGGDSYDGADCYGLIRLYYRDELGIEIPNFDIGAYETKRVFWNFISEISKNWKFIKEPEKNCVAAMSHDANHPKIVQHFGVYLGEKQILHTLENIGSHVVNLAEYRYFIKGFYRWQKHI